MDRGAGGKRRSRETARVGQRLNGSRPQVEERARENVGAETLGGFRRRQRPDRSAALAPLPRALLVVGDPRAADRAVQRSVAHRIAVDTVFVDRVPNHGRRSAEQGQSAFAVVSPEAFHDHVRHDPHAGVDIADVAARAAEAHIDRFEGDDLRAQFGKPQRRGQASIAAADDRDIRLDLTPQRRRRRRGRRRRLPETM